MSVSGNSPNSSRESSLNLVPSMKSPASKEHTRKKFKRLLFGKKRTMRSRSSLPPASPRVGFGGLVVTQVQTRELEPTDFIFVLMGPTGAGKSSFIQTAAGLRGPLNGVGHSLESCTSEVTAFRISFPDGIKVVLVDTPGFDDTYLSDMDVLKIIASWLKDASQYDICGILYLHRVSDNRMAGTPLKNLDMFQKLCGQDFFSRVILTTTMWPEEGSDDERFCVGREKQLEQEYWKYMIDKGTITQRFRNTQGSAWGIIDHRMPSNSRAQWIQIQEELVNQGKRLSGTEAGRRLHGITAETVERRSDLLQRLAEEVGKTDDPAVLQELLSELSELRDERKKAKRDLLELDTTFLGTLRRYVHQFVPSESREPERESGSQNNIGVGSGGHTIGLEKNGTRTSEAGSSTQTSDEGNTIYASNEGGSTHTSDGRGNTRVGDGINASDRNVVSDGKEANDGKDTSGGQNTSNGVTPMPEIEKTSSTSSVKSTLISEDPPKTSQQPERASHPNSSLPPASLPRAGSGGLSARLVQSEELETTDFILVLMGPTGAGKSTFIQKAAGLDHPLSSTDPKSCTNKVSAFRVCFPEGVNVVLVDTPGSDKSDMDLTMVADWVKGAPRGRFYGILYLHRASDNRVAEMASKNLTMFQNLCERDFSNKVILIATKWPEKGSGDEKVCAELEQRPKHRCQSATIRRFDNTQDSAWEIIIHAIATESLRRYIRKREKVENKTGTEAGQPLDGFAAEAVVDFLKRMREKLEKTDDPKVLREVRKELRELPDEQKKVLDPSIFGLFPRLVKPNTLQNSVKLDVVGGQEGTPEYTVEPIAREESGGNGSEGTDHETPYDSSGIDHNNHTKQTDGHGSGDNAPNQPPFKPASCGSSALNVPGGLPLDLSPS